MTIHDHQQAFARTAPISPPPRPELSPEKKAEIQAIWDNYVAEQRAAEAAEAEAKASARSDPGLSHPGRSDRGRSDPGRSDPGDPLAFAVAPTRARHDGWTAERQRLFIRTLAETSCVAAAAGAAGVSPRSAYRLRARPGAEGFDAAWRRALEVASHRLVSLAFDRAIRGVPRGVWRDGQRIGVEYVPSDRLLMFLLRHYDPSRFGALAGIQPCDIPDPTVAALGALPAMVDGLTDQPVDPADLHDTFAPLDSERFDPAGLTERDV